MKDPCVVMRSRRFLKFSILTIGHNLESTGLDPYAHLRYKHLGGTLTLTRVESLLHLLN